MAAKHLVTSKEMRKKKICSKQKERDESDRFEEIAQAQRTWY